MSGLMYFDRILARALEQVPVVLPRRAALFESPLPIRGDRPTEEAAGELPGVDGHTTVPPVRPSRSQVSVRVAGAPVAIADGHDPLPDPERGGGETRHGLDERARVRIENASRLPPVQDRPPVRPGPLPTPAPSLPAPRSGPAAGQRDGTEADQPPARQATGSARGNETSRTRKKDDDRDRLNGQPQRVEERLRALERAMERREAARHHDTKNVAPPRPAAPVRNERAALHDRIVPRATDRAARIAASRPGQPIVERADPVIEVTIGRIEVRATSEPPAAAPRPRSGPRLSLDEYLRQRER